MKPHLIVTCLILIIAGDVLTSFAYNLNLSFYNIGVFIKTPIEFLFLGLIVRYKKFQYLYLIIFGLFLFWLIGFARTYVSFGGIRDGSYGLDFDDNGEGTNPVLASFTILNRYFLFFALMPMLLIHSEDQQFIKSVKKVFEIFLVANSLAIIVGFLFKINFFSSYNSQNIDLPYQPRFGYKGLLYGINEVTGIYFLGIAYAYREIFVYGQKKILLLLLLLIAAALTGTKGCLLAVLILSLYFFFKYKRKLFFIVIGPLFFGLIIYVIETNLIENLSALLNLYLTLDNTNAFSAFLTFFMTGRNLYINENFIYMATHWNFLNYIFGDGVLYSETDLFDLYYFFGVGFLIYFYGYGKLIFYKKNQPDLKYVFVFLLLIAVTGGHIIRSGVFPIFFGLYLITGYFNSEKKLSVA